MSALRTRLHRGAAAMTASTARFTTAITSSHSPSRLVNMALVSLGRPLARTTRTAPPTPSPVPNGVTENATIMRSTIMRGVNPLERFDRAAATATTVVSSIKPEQYDDPTPCADWNVRQLLNHLTGGTKMFTVMVAGG